MDQELLSKYIEELEQQRLDDVPLTKPKKQKDNQPSQQIQEQTEPEAKPKKVSKRPPKTPLQMEAAKKMQMKRKQIVEQIHLKKKIEAGKAYLEELKKNQSKENDQVEELPKQIPKKQQVKENSPDSESESSEEVIIKKKSKSKSKKSKKKIVIVDDSTTDESESEDEPIIKKVSNNNDFGKSHQNRKSKIVNVNRESVRENQPLQVSDRWKNIFCG